MTNVIKEILIPDQSSVGRVDSRLMEACQLNSAGYRWCCANASGYVIKCLLFLPAAGERNNSSGALNKRGYAGIYWSSAQNGSNGQYLYFESDRANMNNNNRAWGFSVRCVAALDCESIFSSQVHWFALRALAFRIFLNKYIDKLLILDQSFVGCVDLRLTEVCRLNSAGYRHCANSSGYVIKRLLFLPAAGYRNYNNGALDYRGNYGFYWSSTQNSSNGQFMRFNSGTTDTNNTNRSFGFSVRCVAAFSSESMFSPQVYLFALRVFIYRSFLDKHIEEVLIQDQDQSSVGRVNSRLTGACQLNSAGYRCCVNNSGYVINCLLFLPAAGYRDNSNGTLNNRGNNGWYWSSTQYNSSNGYNMYLNSGGSNTDNSNRAYGFSVRCVAALNYGSIVGSQVHWFALRAHVFGIFLNKYIDKLLIHDQSFVGCVDLCLTEACQLNSAGYRWCANSSGYVINCLLFLPAAGYRNNSNGTLNNRGNAGYYWSSTQSSSNGRYMYFLSSGTNLHSGYNRSIGISVRCVAALDCGSIFSSQVHWLALRALVFCLFPNECIDKLLIPDQSFVGCIDLRLTGVCRLNSAGYRYCANSSGYVINCLLFLPAAGYRNNSDGTLVNRGDYGFYWSSTQNGSNGRYMYFNSGGANLHDGNNRSNGFSVRCVAALNFESIVSPQVHWFALRALAFRLFPNKLLIPDQSFVGCVDLCLTEACRLNSAGYRWCTNASGYVIKCLLFLPAAGYRNYNNGALNYRGNYGFYWSSSQNSSNGYYMEFNSGGTNTNNTNRSYGFSVRCVAALDCGSIVSSQVHWFALRAHVYGIFLNKYIDKLLIPDQSFVGCVDSCLTGVCQLNSAGYRWCVNSSGYVINCLLFLPAAGYRHNSDGTLNNRGNYGYYWSSTQNGNNGRYIVFDSGSAWLHSGDYRSHGFSVRCVAALNCGSMFSPQVHLFALRVFIYRSFSDKHIEEILIQDQSFVGRVDLRLTGVCRLNSAGYRCHANASGYVINCLLFLPAAGWRNNSNGALDYRGNNGFYWSSTQNGSNGQYMNFNSGGSNTNNNVDRSYGFSVRCVAALNSESMFSPQVYWFALRALILRTTENKCINKILIPDQSSVGCIDLYLMEACQLNSAGYRYCANDFGYVINCLLFLPAAGWRNYSNGALDYRGSNGFYWSSTQNGSYGYRMYFNSGGTDTYTLNRAYGISVRCVAALNCGSMFSPQVHWFALRALVSCFFQNKTNNKLLIQDQSFVGRVDLRLTEVCRLNSAGYRWCVNASGYVIKCLLFLPAAGYREYNNGTLNHRGYYGYYWSSSQSGSNGRFMDFGSSGSDPDYNNRAYGFSVRCVAALDCGSIVSPRVHWLALRALVFCLSLNEYIKKLLIPDQSFVGCIDLCLTGVCRLNSAGYRWCVNASGYVIKRLLFLPAAGLRNYDNGALNERGNNGYYWSSTQDGSNGRYMYFNSGGSNASNNTNRSNGFSVRCVAALDCGSIVSPRVHWLALRALVFCLSLNEYIKKLLIPDQSFVRCIVLRLTGVCRLNSAGYRWCVNASGYVINCLLFLPAAGWRNNSNGALNYRGNRGDYWSSTQNGSNGWVLEFNSGSANTNNGNRSAGFSVRCVAAFNCGSIFSPQVYWFALRALVLHPSCNKTINKLLISDQSFVGRVDSCLTGVCQLNSAGYRWCVNASGYVIKCLLFLPAAGERLNSGGALAQRGSAGIYWSSTQSSSNGYYMYFTSGSTITGGQYRSAGFSVRCVAALNFESIVSPQVHWLALRALVFRSFLNKHIKKILIQDQSFVGCVGLCLTGVCQLNSAGYRCCVNASGYVINCLLFLPAAGYRHNSDGTLNNRGNNGYYWSSNQSGSNGQHMNFNSGGSNTGTPNRANGFSVRCVAAFNRESMFSPQEHWLALRAHVFCSFLNKYIKGLLIPDRSSVGRVDLRLTEACQLNSAGYRWCCVNASGYVINCLLFLPAAGWRNYSNGALNNRGNNGEYWSSTQNGSNGWVMEFNSGNTNTGNTNRSNGFSVRCVAAFKKESIISLQVHWFALRAQLAMGDKNGDRPYSCQVSSGRSQYLRFVANPIRGGYLLNTPQMVNVQPVPYCIRLHDKPARRIGIVGWGCLRKKGLVGGYGIGHTQYKKIMR